MGGCALYLMSGAQWSAHSAIVAVDLTFLEVGPPSAGVPARIGWALINEGAFGLVFVTRDVDAGRGYDLDRLTESISTLM